MLARIDAVAHPYMSQIRFGWLIRREEQQETPPMDPLKAHNLTLDALDNYRTLGSGTYGGIRLGEAVSEAQALGAVCVELFD